MPHNIICFAEAAGKTVGKITPTSATDLRSVSIRLRSCVFAALHRPPNGETKAEVMD